MLLFAAAVWFFFLRFDKQENKKANENVKPEAEAVLTVGEYRVTATEFNYFYRDLAASCDQYAAYLGIDTSVALIEQKVEASDLSMTGLLGLDTSCLDSMTPVDSTYDFTWAQLISYNAMRNAASTYAVYQEAEKAGYQLDSEEVDSIDSSIAEIKTYADQNGVSVDEYIEAVFGRGCDEESYREYLKVINTATAYPDTIKYTVAEKAARDAENPAEFDTVAFYYFITNASTIEEATYDSDKYLSYEDYIQQITADIDYDTINLVDPDSYYDSLANNAAQAMATDFDVIDETVVIYADYTRRNLEYSAGYIQLPEEALDWFFKQATHGEVRMFTMPADYEEDDTDYIVVKFIERTDYFTANYLSISVGSYDNDYEYDNTSEKVAEIKASLEADPSEENFRELILANLDHEHAEGEEHNHSEEGNNENMTRYTAANTSKELFAWLFLEQRIYGDWTMIETDGRTVFYFYLEQGQGYRDMCIENTLLNEWYEELTTNAIANCNYKPDAVLENSNIKFYT